MKTPMEILEIALHNLQNTSKEDVKLRTRELGIEIPQEPKLSCLINHFIFGWILQYMGALPAKRTAADEVEMAKKFAKKITELRKGN